MIILAVLDSILPKMPRVGTPAGSGTKKNRPALRRGRFQGVPAAEPEPRGGHDGQVNEIFGPLRPPPSTCACTFSQMRSAILR